MPLTLERVRALTVLELRKELKARGEESKGNKALLVERLTKAVTLELAEAAANAPKKRPGRPSKKKPAAEEGATASAGDEKEREEEAPKASSKTDADANVSGTAGADAGADDAAEDDNPLSEARMKRRAERFGLPWPPKKGESGAKRAKLDGQAAAIAPFTLTADEIKKREERTKRFAVPPGDAVEGAK